MMNVKKLNRQTVFLSVAAALLIAGIGTSTAALASKVTPQVVADTQNEDSRTTASEIAASKVPEGKVTESVQGSGTQPAESSTIPVQEYKAGQLVAGPAEAADSVTVPAELTAVSDQAEITAQPQPELVAAPANELVADPEESAPATVPDVSSSQSDSGIAPAPVPAGSSVIAEALPELVPAPAESVPAPAK